jgi:hypothetical protein
VCPPLELANRQPFDRDARYGCYAEASMNRDWEGSPCLGIDPPRSFQSRNQFLQAMDQKTRAGGHKGCLVAIRVRSCEGNGLNRKHAGAHFTGSKIVAGFDVGCGPGKEHDPQLRQVLLAEKIVESLLLRKIGLFPVDDVVKISADAVSFHRLVLKTPAPCR